MQVAPDNRLRELRDRHGLKLYDVAALVRKDPSMVWRYETGRAPVPMDVAEALADRYGVSLDVLMGREKEAA